MIITRVDDELITRIEVKNSMLSDHLAVHCKLRLNKPQLERTEIQYRKLKLIDMVNFNEELKKSDLILKEHTALPDLINKYEETLKVLLDTHAPMKRRIITLRPSASWYNESINEAKRKRRRLERRWRKSRLCIDRQLYAEQCKAVNDMLKQAKVSYYSSIISENKFNQSILFNTVDKLLHRKPERRYPTAPSTLELSNTFADFFQKKIIAIRNELSTKIPSVVQQHPEEQVASVELTEFKVMTESEVDRLINMSGLKSCELDPIPASVLKGCRELLLPVFTNIVNLSLQTAHVPSQFKDAMVRPKIKKASLDSEKYPSFRPISNLKFISKVTEKAVAHQLNKYVSNNDLGEYLQSAYKCFHSTETALLKVQNDILRAIDEQKCIVLLLLDMSSAFDTVDHDLLLARLSSRFGIKNQVLKWFESYLRDRTQFVVIDGVKSDVKELQCGVPQGSVLGPMLYLLYTAPLGDIIKRHGLSYHLYADDTQLYFAFKPTPTEQQASIERIEACVCEIDSWMVSNKLKLNREKTELLVLSARHRPRPLIESVQVANEQILPSVSARNIGVIFDQDMFLEQHVADICKVCFYHLRNIARIRDYLSLPDTETLVHAFITTKLDSCNSLLVGLPKSLLDRLQSVQNSAARLITRSKKYEHISPVMKQLHWLPVSSRITYKILLITFKALNGLAPGYISDLLQAYKPARQLRSSARKLLSVPTIKLATYGQRSFSHAAPVLWNSLPDSLRHCATLSSFKSNIKTYLFKQAYDI